MDLLTQFEYKMPIMQSNVSNININISSSYEGSFTITNVGGGLLTGKVMSTSSFLEFMPEFFEGNTVKIEYFVSLSMYKPGDKLKTTIVIVSTGGEIEIPFTINVIPSAIESKDGKRITSLSDFYEYSKEEPLLARQLFMNNDFEMWLFNMSFPYLDAYDIFIKDANKERALDNFFIITGLKTRGRLFLDNKKIVIHANPNEKNPITEYFDIFKDDNSYIEDTMHVETSTPWLSLDKDKLTSKDFDENNKSIASFTVDMSKLTSELTTGKIKFAKCHETLTVLVIKRAVFKVDTSKSYYNSSENGILSINNYSNKEINVEVSTPDTYLRFEQTSYKINAAENIPFKIKVPTLLMASFLIKKQPYLKTSITVKTKIDNQYITEIIPISIGDL